MELAKTYNPEEVEGKWYQYWTDNHLSPPSPMDANLILW